MQHSNINIVERLRSCNQLTDAIQSGAADGVLHSLYPDAEMDAARGRYVRLVEKHAHTFGGSPPCSAPRPHGTRWEPHGSPARQGPLRRRNRGHGGLGVSQLLRVVRVASEGFPDFEVDIDRLEPLGSEAGSPASLIRGIAAAREISGL